MEVSCEREYSISSVEPSDMFQLSPQGRNGLPNTVPGGRVPP